MKRYIWFDELGELPRAKEEKTGKVVSLDQLCEGDIIRFQKNYEVVLRGGINPECYVTSIRRALDGIGIEIIDRGQAGMNSSGDPAWTIEGPDDVIDQYVSKGRGYQAADKLLRDKGM